MEIGSIKTDYEFKDIALLECALTHRSFANENSESVMDNQRLEFLGDAVLGLVVAEALMERHPDAPEGVMTEKRATLVNEGSLADIAREIDLGSVLRLGRGEELSNGRDRTSILADALEALLGAVYLDGGYRAAREVVLRWFGDRLDEDLDREEGGDVKGALQRILQERSLDPPTYRLVNEEGPDHAKVFEVELVSEGKVLSTGRGRSKKEAEKRAAARALKGMKEES